MATAMPDGWKIEGGTIGTEIDIDTTTYATGGSSMKFIGTGSNAAKLLSDWIPLPGTNAGANRPVSMSVNALLKASSSIAASSITIQIEVAPADRSTLTTVSVFASNMPSTNWVNIGNTVNLPGNPSWARLKIFYTSNSAFNFWIDTVEMKQHPAGMLLNDTDGGTFSATWAKVTFGAPDVSAYSFSSLSSSEIYVYSAGLYQCSANVQLADADYVAGDMFGIRLDFQDYAGANLFYRYGSTTTIHANHDASTNNLGLTLATAELMVPDNNQSTTVPSQVSLELIQHTNTGTLQTYGDVNFCVARITDR